MTQTPHAPIGVFDSGYGGLTILKEVMKELPEYDYLYLGDNARNPYGTRSFEVVYQYTLEAVKYLFSQGCELVILACNTASAKALRTIQQVDLPRIAPNKRVLGVIRPSVEALADMSSSGHIGILATIGTVKSESYPLELSKIDPALNVFQEACPMWVPIVENNEINSPGAEYFVKKNVENLMKHDTNIDTVVLGCTHYPLLAETIRKFIPQSVRLVAQGEVVADSLKDYLKRHPEMEEQCSKQETRRFITTETAEVFQHRARLFLGKEISAETVHF